MSRTKRKKPYWADGHDEFTDPEKLTRDGALPKPLSPSADRSGWEEVWSQKGKKAIKKRSSKFQRITKIDPQSIDEK